MGLAPEARRAQPIGNLHNDPFGGESVRWRGHPSDRFIVVDFKRGIAAVTYRAAYPIVGKRVRSDAGRVGRVAIESLLPSCLHQCPVLERPLKILLTGC